MKRQIKRLGVASLSIFMMTTSILGSPKTTIKANNGEGALVSVEQESNRITIGNEHIAREFSIANEKLHTSKIINKRTQGDTVFTPQEGSNEFRIKLTKPESKPIVLPAIDRTNWSAQASSYQNASGASDGPASNLLDGNPASIWHSAYNSTGHGPEAMPHYVLFDLKEATTFQSFSYTPRSQGEFTNGNIKEYELFVSNEDTKQEADATSWQSVASGSFIYDGENPIYVNLDHEVSAKQVKFVAKSSTNGERFAGGAEFNLHQDKAPIVDNKREFVANDLTLDAANIKVEDTTATINKVEKSGKKITFPFKTYTFKNVDYTINEVMVMYDGDHFMRKYLEISVPNDQKEKAVIDYIDLESLKVNERDAQWTIPTDAGGVVSLNAFKANLGQPIYIQGMFFGCEFPVTDTEIVDGTGFMRYYSGKSFAQLEQDKQLTSNKDAATYMTWQTVAGAARSVETSVIQSDFFEYIDSISTPSEFRIQYNSWFDNMMRIDDDNILESFIEMDKELNKSGVRPLDSYVVDDGWNNYNNTSIVDAVRSGTTLNETGFWEFNSKFPDGLKPSSTLVQNFGSNFGVWVGPRGGYNFYGSLADILTKNKTGSKAGGSVDVADRTYLKNFEDMAVKWQKDYKVNYWKWDGYADDAQFNQWPAKDGVPSRANDHMVGGTQNMYHVTDLWEGWIDLFEKVRTSEEEDAINKLWISLTCYVNPSPWFLQWSNSVWMQCTGDRGESGSIPGKMDTMLTYRDAMYYDFIVNHQFQFPLANIYNHDPIYGTEGTGINMNSMSDEQFKNYLYMMATRGTGFWELYYSDSIMSKGKYEVNAEFLAWAEENYHILKNAKMLGGSPAEGVKLNSSPMAVGNGGNTYGFSAWDGEDGIISMRNADTKEKEFTFTLDRNIGLAESVSGKTLYKTSIQNYKTPAGKDNEYKEVTYGDTISVRLAPGETRIWSLSTKKDVVAPSINSITTDGDKTITVKYDEKVKGTLFTVEGQKISSIKKSQDNITYEIVLTKAPEDGTKLNVSAKDIQDLSGNKASMDIVTTNYHAGNVVNDFAMQELSGIESGTGTSLNSNSAFTVSTQVKTTTKNTVLAHQEGGYTTGIDNDGYAFFELNGARATSNTKVNDNTQHTIVGVKENNGILKLYIDGTLAKSSYKKENKDFKIEQGTTSVGSETFTGAIANRVFDTGYGYDEIADLHTSLARLPIRTDAMEVSVSGTTSGNKDAIFDGDSKTYWTSNAVEQVSKNDPWLEIDLGGMYLIDRIDYQKRLEDGKAYQSVGNILEYNVQTSNDNGATWRDVATGSTTADETSKGLTQISFKEARASNVRISATSTYGSDATSANKKMSVGDIAIFGKKASVENIALQVPVIGKWTKSGEDVNVNPAKPLSNIVEGNKTLNAYADFGADNKTESSYIQLDLGKVNEIDSLNLYRYFADGRTYKGTVISLSETADFTNQKIVYNSDAENFHGLGSGSDAKYAESANGKSIAFDKAHRARYVRVYMHGSSSGNTNHIVELEVMGYKQTEEVDTDIDVTSLIDRLLELSTIDRTSKTTRSLEALDKVVQEALDFIMHPNTQAEVDAMLAKVDEAYAQLVDLTALKQAIAKAQEIVDTMTVSSSGALRKTMEDAKALFINGTNAAIEEAIQAITIAQEDTNLVARGDTKELAALVKSYEDLDEFAYTQESWATYIGALEKAKAIVLDNSDASTSDVNEAKQSLKQAKEGLVLAKPASPDKQALASAIQEAEAIDKALYTKTSYANVSTELNRAIAGNESNTITQQQVNELVLTLQQAMTSLESVADVRSAKALLDELNGKNLKAEDYTNDSWAAFAKEQSALEAIVNDNSDTNTAQLEIRIKAVNKAFSELVKKPQEVNKQELQALYNANKDKQKGKYSDETWNAFVSARSISKTILENSLATQSQVDESLRLLQSAIKNLKEVEVVNPAPEKPGTIPSKPEANKPTITDPTGTISIEGNLDKGVSLIAQKLSEEKVASILASVKDTTFLSEYKIHNIFDITMIKDGKTINPDGTLTVKIKVDKALLEKDVDIVYIAEDGSITFMNARKGSDTLEFDTTHFSNYAIVEKTKQVDTSDTTSTKGMMVVLLLSGMALVFLKKKKRSSK